jgi:hypothetical protein
VGFAFAVAGPQAGLGVLGLDAVEQPVGAARRAGGDAQFGPEPLLVALLPNGFGFVNRPGFVSG